MTSMTDRAGRYLGDALRGIRQAPVEVIATLAVAATFSWAVESEAGQPAFQTWAEIAVSCALLLVGAWTATLLHATGRWDAPRRWAFTAGVAIIVAIYAMTVADFRHDAEAWRAALLVAAAVAWLVALPAFTSAGLSGEAVVARVRSVNGRFALRVIGAILYGAALFLGLALALAAVDNLFELKLEEKIYQHVWGCVAFVLIPWIVIGGLDDYVSAASPLASTSSGVASVASRIALWLVPPLLALYTLILYAYVVRILVTGEIPKNLVSPMVLGAGVLAALALLLFDPQPARGGLARWLRLAPALFIPLAPLGYWAVIARVEQYGWTEFRVVRLVVLSALVALAIAATIQLARRRAFSLHIAPIALTVVLLLSAVGPWSVLALSKKSQQVRLDAALAKVHDAPAPGTDSARVVPAATYEQIREGARYLAAHFGADALPVSLQRFAAARPSTVDFAAQLGLRPDRLLSREGRTIGGTLGRSAALEIEGGQAYRISWTRDARAENRPEGEVMQRDPSPVRVALRDGLRLELTVDGRLLNADLRPLLSELERSTDATWPRQLPPQRALVPLADASGVQAGGLVVWDLRARADSTGWRLQRVEGLVVVR